MRVEFHKNFKKRFALLSTKVQMSFQDRLALFMQDTFNDQLNNHSVDKAYPKCRSINITGDYRAIFQQQGDVVIFMTIGTHAQLYS